MLNFPSDLTFFTCIQRFCFEKIKLNFLCNVSCILNMTIFGLFLLFSGIYLFFLFLCSLFFLIFVKKMHWFSFNFWLSLLPHLCWHISDISLWFSFIWTVYSTQLLIFQTFLATLSLLIFFQCPFLYGSWSSGLVSHFIKNDSPSCFVLWLRILDENDFIITRGKLSMV